MVLINRFFSEPLTTYSFHHAKLHVQVLHVHVLQPVIIYVFHDNQLCVREGGGVGRWNDAFLFLSIVKL